MSNLGLDWETDTYLWNRDPNVAKKNVLEIAVRNQLFLSLAEEMKLKILVSRSYLSRMDLVTPVLVHFGNYGPYGTLAPICRSHLNEGDHVWSVYENDNVVVHRFCSLCTDSAKLRKEKLGVLNK